MYTLKQEFKFWLPLLILIVVIVAGFAKYHSVRYEKQSRAITEWSASQTNNFYSLYTFKLSPNSKEYKWSNALSDKLGGIREKQISAGRIDIVTDNFAIEVERFDKWHEGIGQALHYGLYVNKQPALAIITYPPNDQRDMDTLDVIINVCKKYDIKLIVMMAKVR